MSNTIILMTLLLACATEVLVSSHILVGRDADVYKDGMEDEDKLRMPGLKLRKSQGNRGREKQLSKKIRRVIARMADDASNACAYQQLVD